MKGLLLFAAIVCCTVMAANAQVETPSAQSCDTVFQFQNKRAGSSHGGFGSQGGTPYPSGTDVHYSLGGRKLVHYSRLVPSEFSQEEVVVTIEVNRSGKVVKAVCSQKDLPPRLALAAKKAALATRFNPDKDAPELQKGTITFLLKE